MGVYRVVCSVRQSWAASAGLLLPGCFDFFPLLLAGYAGECSILQVGLGCCEPGEEKRVVGGMRQPAERFAILCLL